MPKKLKNKRYRTCDTPGCNRRYLPTNYWDFTCILCKVEKERKELQHQCKLRKLERAEARRRRAEDNIARCKREWNRKNCARLMRELYWRRKAEAEAVKQVPR